MITTSFNFNQLPRALAYVSTKAILEMNELVTTANLQRVAYIIDAQLNNLNQATGFPLYSNLHAAARGFFKVTDVLYLLTLGSMWFRPVNADQMLNKEDMVREVEYSILLALSEDYENTLPLESRDVTYAKLKQDNIALIHAAVAEALTKAKAEFKEERGEKFCRAIQYVTAGILEKKGVQFKNLHLKKIDFQALNEEPLEEEAYTDMIVENVTKGLVLREVARNALKTAFKTKYRDEETFREKLKDSIKTEIEKIYNNEEQVDLVHIDVTGVPVTKPCLLEKIYWTGLTVSTIANALSQGYEWQLYYLPEFTTVASKLGMSKVFNFSAVPFSLGTIAIGSFFLGNLFKLLESQRRFIEIKRKREKERNCWDNAFALANVILYGAFLVGGLSARKVNNLTIAVKTFEVVGGIVKSKWAPAAPF